MPHLRQFALPLAAATAIACSAADLTDPKVIADHLPGIWSQTFDIPGQSVILNLRVSGSAITGDGSFADEAGPSGALTVTGDIEILQTGDPPVVHLDFPRSDGVTGHYNGTLEAANVMEGSIWYTSPQFPAADPASAEFRKILPG